MTAFVLLHVAAAWGFALIALGWEYARKFTGAWRWAVLAIAAAAILVNEYTSLLGILAGADTDWRILAEAGRRAGTASLYVVWDDGAYRYSPLYAWLLIPLGWIGHWGWALGHVLVLPLFRDRRVIGLLAVSWPFWFDAVNGNVLVFTLLAAWWAMRGNKAATFAYLALTLLTPRPLMIPVAIWILWQRPEWRLPFVGMFVVHAVAVALTGFGDEWLGALFATGEMLAHPLNYGPSRIIGLLWVPIGLALGAWALWHGRVGLASLAVTPYLIPYYWLFAALAFLPRQDTTRSANVFGGSVSRPLANSTQPATTAGR